MINQAELSPVLQVFPDLQLAILFGSQADGRAGPESDIDLAVLFSHPLSAEERMQIIEQLAEQFGRPVDLIDMHGAGLPILGQVFKGKKIFGSARVYGERLSRYLIDAADFMPIRERILKERRESWIGS